MRLLPRPAALPLGLAAITLLATGLTGCSDSDGEKAPLSASGFTQQLSDAGTPLRWEPCRPIHYVTNLTEAPYDTALADIQRAVSEVAKYSHLRFVYDGSVTQQLRSAYSESNNRAGTHDTAPLLIGFGTKESSDVLDGSDGLLGETEIASDPDTELINSAVLVLNAADEEVEPGYGEGTRWGSVMLHEMAHAVGLDHVSNPGELMNPELTDDLVDFGPGDKKGLADAGSGGCSHD